MKKREIKGMAAVFCIVMLYAGAVFAAYIEIDLNRVFPETRARGIVKIEPAPFVPSDRLLTVDVYYMEKKAVYSVWIIDNWSGERVPAGIPGQNFFRTDGAGYAHYTDHTTEYVLGWNKLEVAYHPDGDPSNTKDMVVVLWARLYE